MRDRVAIVLTAATAVLHLAVANRYDLFRDELYFIVCGQHPQFGYADQPPLVPLVAAAGYALGGQTWVVRLPAVAAAAALVWLVVAFVRLLDGDDAAAWLGGIAAATAPMLMGLTATLNTTTFEPLAWTFVAYALARAALLDDRRALVWAGVVAGIAMEAKYALPLWLIVLCAGILVAGPRELLRRRELWIGLAIASALAAPSVLWQAMHGWPFVELVRNAKLKDSAVGPLAFALNQLVVMNVLLAPAIVAGLIAPFVMPAQRTLRFISIAFALSAIAIVAGGGKDYYLAPAYPSILALGAVALSGALRANAVRAGYATLVVANAAVVAPLALPILDPPVLAAYMRALPLQPQSQERSDRAPTLPPTFEDMVGWRTFADQVRRAYAQIPETDRAATAIVVDNYGEAAALDVYARGSGLPPALSGQNQYGLWGTRGQTPRNVLSVQDNPGALHPYCATVRVIDTTSAVYARAFENGKAIAFCGGLHPPLGTLWPQIRFLL